MIETGEPDDPFSFYNLAPTQVLTLSCMGPI